MVSQHLRGFTMNLRKHVVDKYVTTYTATFGLESYRVTAKSKVEARVMIEEKIRNRMR